MGKVTVRLLKDFNDPIFDSPYEIFTPRKLSRNNESAKKKVFLNKKRKYNKKSK
jgi:hypothetical protein